MPRLAPIVLLAYVVASSILIIGYAAYLVTVTSQQLFSFVLALVFLLASIVVAVLNVTAGIIYSSSHFVPRNDRGAKPPARLPTVAIVVPTCDEDPRMIGENLASLRALDYPSGKLEFWLVDNSAKAGNRRRIAAMAREHGFRYAWRDRAQGFKAGSLNFAIRKSKTDFLAVFDADENLHDAAFLSENIGYFSRDDRLAFVQTEKKARPSSGPFADSVEANYSFFYKYTEPLRSSIGMAMYSGSAAIVRMSVLRELGGFQTSPPTPSEDTEFSFRADIAGYRGLYVAKCYAYGEPVRAFSAFVRQQWKYAYGLARMLPDYLRNFRKVKGWKKHVFYLENFLGFPYASLLIIFLALLSLSLVLSNLSFTMVSFSEIVSVLYQPINSFYPVAPFLFQLKQSVDAVGAYYVPGMPLYDLSPVVANVLNLVVISRFYFGSFRKGVMCILLNVSVAFKRSEAVLAASLRDLSEIPVTLGAAGAGVASSIVSAARFTILESAYALFFLVFTAFSLLRGDFVGAFWMLWYGFVFGLAFVFAVLFR